MTSCYRDQLIKALLSCYVFWLDLQIMPVKELVNRAFLMTKMFAVNKIRHSFLA